MSSHVNIAIQWAQIAHRHFHHYYFLNQLPRLQSNHRSHLSHHLTRTTLIRSCKFLQQTLFNYIKLFLLESSLPQTAVSNKRQCQPWRNKQSVDIWGWCHTPFQSYRPQLRATNDNVSRVSHFQVADTHKAGCEIRDCKKKAQNFQGREKNEAIICRDFLPHHKRARSFVNTYTAARLHFLHTLLRYRRISERVQHEQRCSCLHDRWRFRYDEQCSLLHAEGLTTDRSHFTQFLFVLFCFNTRFTQLSNLRSNYQFNTIWPRQPVATLIFHRTLPESENTVTPSATCLHC